MNSHSAIQGTARPVHYHVLLDEANIPPNVFQNMIYQSCYQYMRSTTPVSLCKSCDAGCRVHPANFAVVPAVYYAHLASNRARAHEDVPKDDDSAHGGQKNRSETSRDKNTEAKMLTELGVALHNPADRMAIKTGMWYI